MTTTIRARFDGKVLVPEGPVDLPKDETLTLHIDRHSEHPPGSPAGILEALRFLKPVPKEDIEEMLRAIDEAQGPPRDEDIFANWEPQK
jgi:hypothetical protein